MFKKALAKYEKMPIQAKASLWYLICSFLQKAISVLSGMIFTRIMSTDAYGDYQNFTSWLGIIGVILTLRLYWGVYSQGLVKFDGERDEYSSTLLALTSTLTAAGLFVYLLAYRFWNDLFQLTTLQMLAMFLIIWTESSFCFWASRQRVENNYRKLVILTLLVAFFQPALGILAVKLSPEHAVTAKVWEIALVNFVAYIALFVGQMSRGKRFFSGKHWKYGLVLGIPLIPHYLSQTVLNSSDRIMVKRIEGSTPAAIYGVAYALSQLMTMFTTALNQTISPWIYQKIKDKKTEDIKSVVYPTILFIGFVSVLLMCFAPEAVAIFAPPAYAKAIWAIPPVAMSVFFVHMYNVFSGFEFYHEKSVFITISTCLAAALNVGLNLVFIPKYGFVAAGYTTLVSYMVYAFAHYLFMEKIERDEDGVKHVFEPGKLLLFSAVFLLIGAVITFSYTNRWIRYGIILLTLVLTVIFRKKLTAFVKKFLFRKKEEA